MIYIYRNQFLIAKINLGDMGHLLILYGLKYFHHFRIFSNFTLLNKKYVLKIVSKVKILKSLLGLEHMTYRFVL